MQKSENVLSLRLLAGSDSNMLFNIFVNVAAPALACAGKLWEMGSRNPVEVLQGMICE